MDEAEKIFSNESHEAKEFRKIFPQGTKIIKVSGSIEKFDATLRLPSKNKDEFESWLKEYANMNKLTFRIGTTKIRTGKTVLYKAVYRCHHNTYPKGHQKVKKAHKKNTDCPAKLRITIKSPIEGRRIRSKDVLRSEYPTLITLEHHHNHNVIAAEAVGFRDMSEEVKEKLTDMFRSHRSPATALEILKQDLMEEHGLDYYTFSADTAICPNIQSVFRLYYSVFKKEYGDEKECIKDTLEEIVKQADEKTKIMYSILGENEFVLAAIPPLMQRVHELKFAKQIVFVDSTGNMDRYNCRVFLFLCDSNVGGLPLGFLMTSSETEDVIIVQGSYAKNRCNLDI